MITRDKKGRLLTETVDIGCVSKTYQHSYYANGLTQSLIMPNQTTYSYQYDANNQLTRLQIPGQGSLTTNVYNWLAPAKETFPGGLSREYGYTGLLALSALDVKTSHDQSILSLAYQYGSIEEVLQRKNNRQTIYYQYDRLNRLQQALTTADESSASGASGDSSVQTDENSIENYVFDANNNITDSELQANWVYNSAGQLTEKGDDRYFYDANGNQIKNIVAEVTRHFIYNARDRLVRIENSNNDAIASYAYDPMGRRIRKTVSGATTYYLYTPYLLTDNTGFVVWSGESTSFGKTVLSITNKITNSLLFPG